EPGAAPGNRGASRLLAPHASYRMSCHPPQRTRAKKAPVTAQRTSYPPQPSACVAIAIGGASTALVELNALVAALTCGDDGPLDYGTASGAETGLCRVSLTLT